MAAPKLTAAALAKDGRVPADLSDTRPAGSSSSIDWDATHSYDGGDSFVPLGDPVHFNRA